MRVIIIGGGPVGQVLARRLVNHEVTLFDRPVTKPAMTLALSETTVQQLAVLDIPLQFGSALQTIHVSERGVPGSMRLDASRLGFDAFGHVVCSHDLERVFQASPAVHIDPRAVISVRARSQTQGPSVRLEDGTDVSADLVCLCDGGRSPLVEGLGMMPQYREFGRTAVLMRVDVSQPRDQYAFERFTPSGPLALLPLGGSRYGLVWSLPPNQAARGTENPEMFLEMVQAALGDLLGQLTAVNAPVAIPLVERWLDAPFRPGVAVFGNGAQTIHPVAGQGLNLALRGVSRIVEGLEGAQVTEIDRHIQMGFRAWHRDRAQTRAASSLLEQAFSWHHPFRQLVSGATIAMLDHHELAQRWIAEAGMGRYA